MTIPTMRIGNSTRSRYSLLLLALLLVAAATAAAVALTQAQSANGVYDTDSDGLIEVDNIDQLNAMRYDLDGDGNPDHSIFEAAYAAAFSTSGGDSVCETGCYGFELDRDLDFTDGASYAAGRVNPAMTQGAGWFSFATFSATFDGNGHTISNLLINGTVNNLSDVGLFGRIQSAVIRNIGLLDVDVTGGPNVGGLVGRNIEGVISYAYVTGRVSGTSENTGGLVGWNQGPVSFSYATSNVSSSSSSVGGLVGFNDGSISSSYATGEVSGGTTSVGGLAGYLRRGSVSHSYAIGSVTAQTGATSVGGLVGTRIGGAVITSSYWNTDNTTAVGFGEGKTTAELQEPTDSSGIYVTWSPRAWDFGSSSQYPALKADFDGDGTATAAEFGGQGRGPGGPAPTPTPPPTGESYTDFSIGAGHVCLLRNDGLVFCDGNNSHGQASPPDPERLYLELDGGDTWTCGLREGGLLVDCWGSVSGTFDRDNPPPTPAPTPGSPPAATPGPTPGATLAPTATPGSGDDACVVNLGAQSGEVTRNDSWLSQCESYEDERGYARYYTFTLDRRSEVTISLESTVDTYLYLRDGEAISGDPDYSNDDHVDGGLDRDTDSQIVAILEADTYTIETTTYNPNEEGNFTLTLNVRGQ